MGPMRLANALACFRSLVAHARPMPTSSISSCSTVDLKLVNLLDVILETERVRHLRFDERRSGIRFASTPHRVNHAFGPRPGPERRTLEASSVGVGRARTIHACGITSTLQAPVQDAVNLPSPNLPSCGASTFQS